MLTKSFRSGHSTTLKGSAIMIFSMLALILGASQCLGQQHQRIHYEEPILTDINQVRISPAVNYAPLMRNGYDIGEGPSIYQSKRAQRKTSMGFMPMRGKKNEIEKMIEDEITGQMFLNGVPKELEPESSVFNQAQIIDRQPIANSDIPLKELQNKIWVPRQFAGQVLASSQRSAELPIVVYGEPRDMPRKLRRNFSPMRGKKVDVAFEALLDEALEENQSNKN